MQILCGVKGRKEKEILNMLIDPWIEWRIGRL